MPTNAAPSIPVITAAEDPASSGLSHSAQLTSARNRNGTAPAIGVNIGCGATPTPGWLNLDNSLTVRLAYLGGLFSALPLLGRERLHFMKVARKFKIRWANAAVHIPLPDASVRVVYSCGMPILLDPNAEMPRFLAEVQRVLIPGGVIRLAVDDLLRAAGDYVLHTRDADAFVSSLHVMRGIRHGRLGDLRNLLVGYRGSRWIYDAASVGRLLERHGFCSAREFPPGETMIPNPGSLNLREREEEKYVYVEALRA